MEEEINVEEYRKVILVYFVLDDKFCNECLYVFAMKKKNSICIYFYMEEI